MSATDLAHDDGDNDDDDDDDYGDDDDGNERYIFVVHTRLDLNLI